MLESGYRISDLDRIPVTGITGSQKNKIALDETYMLGYANTVYGIKYNRNNYKIPLTSIREDIKGYIGVESLVAPWSEQMKFWHGNWNNIANKNKSYVYEWQEDEKTDPHYMPDKFSDLENSYYLIKDAPFPFETEELHNRDFGEITPAVNIEGENVASTNVPLAAGDPYPDSNKLVLKSYVDERLASKRLVEVMPEFRVRDYDCTYIIRADVLKAAEESAGGPIDICIHYPKQFEDRIKHNNLEFKLLLEGVKEGDTYVPALKNNVKWFLFDSSGNQLEICWLNKSTESIVDIPNVAEERYYINARHLSFSFRTVTNNILNHEKFEIVDGKEEKTGEYTTAVYSVYALCENMVYHNKHAIDTINNITNIQRVDITSEDGTITIDSYKTDASAVVDLSTNVKPRDYFIQSPDNSISITSISDDKSTTFNLRAHPLKTFEIVSSDSINVVENKINNITYYTLNATSPTFYNSDGYIKVVEAKGPDANDYSWCIDSNIRYTAGDGISIREYEEFDDTIEPSDNEKIQPLTVLEISSTIDVQGSENIRVDKRGDNFIISADIDNTANNLVLKPSDGNITFHSSNINNYYITDFSQLVLNDELLNDEEIGKLTVYINTKNRVEDLELNIENISWVMNNVSAYPRLRPGRLYSITFTSISDVILGMTEGRSIYGKVDWFKNI